MKGFVVVKACVTRLINSFCKVAESSKLATAMKSVRRRSSIQGLGDASMRTSTAFDHKDNKTKIDIFSNLDSACAKLAEQVCPGDHFIIADNDSSEGAAHVRGHPFASGCNSNFHVLVH